MPTTQLTMTGKIYAVSSLLVLLTLTASVGAGRHSWRYVFPFFPDELDVLLGHLRTSVFRLKEVLEQCTKMAEGEWKGGKHPNGVMRLSDPETDDKDKSMDEKVERILELREIISELEDEIEECRFHFWTGEEV